MEERENTKKRKKVDRLIILINAEPWQGMLEMEICSSSGYFVLIFLSFLLNIHGSRTPQFPQTQNMHLSFYAF